MIYLKRFLFTLITIILCVVVLFIVLLHLTFALVGMIISFIVTGDSMKYFGLLTRLEEYIPVIDGKLERVLLK